MNVCVPNDEITQILSRNLLTESEFNSLRGVSAVYLNHHWTVINVLCFLYNQLVGINQILWNLDMYVVLPKISENLNILRKPLALRTCATRCLFLYLSTNSVATGVFISARVSEFWLFSLHHFHECLRLSKWRELRSKKLLLQAQQNCSWDPPNAKGGLWWASFKPSKNSWVV